MRMQPIPRILAFVILVALTSLAAISTLRASRINIPLEQRLEQADLVIVGRVIADTTNYYETPGNWCGRGQAVVTVIEVLRGKLESPHPRLVNDYNVQTVRMRHYEEVVPESGNFHQMVMDPAYKDRIDGIWFLRRSEVPGVYCADSQFAERLDQLVEVRKFLRGVFDKPSSPEH